MRSHNPTLRDSVFRQGRAVASDAQVMTIDGTMGKLAILLLLMTGAAAFTWSRVGIDGINLAAAQPWMMGGGLAGFILCLVISFKPNLAPVLAPVFAICEGLLLGAVSALFATVFQGIVMQAVLLTIGITFVMLTLYRFRVIRVTQKLRAIVYGAFLAMFAVYMLTFVLSLFEIGMPYLHDAGPVGIGISVLFVVICAFMLLLDFDLIERGARQGAPKMMEWYGAFALLVTLVWLYIELLRLLAKLRSD